MKVKMTCFAFLERCVLAGHAFYFIFLGNEISERSVEKIKKSGPFALTLKGTRFRNAACIDTIQHGNIAMNGNSELKQFEYVHTGKQ